MLCTVLKTFNYSLTGMDTTYAKVGTHVDLPDAMAIGLEREGFVTANKSITVPENKVISSAPENKSGLSVTRGPRGLYYLVDGGQRRAPGFNTKHEAHKAMLTRTQ